MSFAYGRNGVGGHFPLWYWRYRRRVAVAGYAVRGRDLVDCALRRLFHSVLSLRQPSKNGDRRAVLNGAEECAGGVGDAIPYTMAKPNGFHS